LVVAGNAEYPERFAQQALGHNSKAVHYAYSKHAEVTVPSLDDWEKQWKRQPVARGQKLGIGDQVMDGCKQAAKSLEPGGTEMPKPAVVQVDFRSNEPDPCSSASEISSAAAEVAVL
jgi:hypothetical protein